MRKILIFSMMVTLVACNQTKNENAVNTSQTENIPVQIPADTLTNLPQEVYVTPFEMKDDSVFTNGSIPSSWEMTGINDVAGFKLFLKQLQFWIMDNDKEKLATVINYPLKNIKTPEELVKHYDAVFTKDVKLSFATINFNQIFRNIDGASTDGGEVWFNQIDDSFKIITINY